MKKKVLLHICCGVCSLYCIERLKAEDYALEGFFYNPNISPPEEYNLRRDAARQACELMAVAFHEAEYTPELWQKKCAGYEHEPEGGKRCHICYEMRLHVTKDFAQSHQFDYFATTLSISPHKDSFVIGNIARSLGGKNFLDIDFKKNNGFARTIQLAKTHAIYRQRYCGCLYAKLQQEAAIAAKKKR